MSVVLLTNNKNGAKNIDASRQATNKSNLEEGIICWQEILTIDEEKFPNYRNYKSSNKNTQQQVSVTIPNRLTKNFIHYGLDSPNDISWVHIKEMAKKYLESDDWLQINFCKDSTRQSVDEQVQRRMLNEYLGENTFTKCKPSMFVYNGKLLNKKDYKAHEGSQVKTRKDIDTFGNYKNNKFWIFQKYAKVSGGHQDNVSIETTHFLNDADVYANKNKNNNFFIAQLDGNFIESLFPKFKKETINTNRVFVGNTEEVIDWIRKI
ncbi:MAG: hypothetical protein HOF02_08425 [Gammaproteobacteria bacterium]|jgi:hypothetical protein|nr:hypothetical protein [Gammaproteobacteria bacterium]MBT7753816.1 hypothetical protein [Gammaproteobacteria bacterium]